MEKAEIDVKW